MGLNEVKQAKPVVIPWAFLFYKNIL